ncbi:acyltransferase [Limosilactobacillus vaginalis]|uniref:acyltransferase n=1 Tax=Limosilactobacillus vaginalis TaxID=1633 RepID=UPI002583A998|nr:acyltransferase family protein [Limosilactobacillus vaginalis]MDM8304012.1 acyltransferase family protein [Limosilactobacillus vaginalis]
MKERDSNLELLRIISMFFIVLHHYAYHGSFKWATQYNNLFFGSEKVYLFLSCLGKAAVISFVMIGAYFLSMKSFKLIRVVQLSVTTLIYSWLIFLFLLWKFPAFIKINSISSILLPIPIPSNYWFVIAYIYMLLFMSFMNLIIRKLSRRQILTIIFLFIFFWTILYFVQSDKLDNDSYSFFNVNNYFLLIYLIAGYIRKYDTKWAKSFFTSFFLFIGALIVTLLFIFFIPDEYYNRLSGIMASLNNPLALFLGVTIFVVFKNINIGHNVVINYLSKSMFGVYLIHDNSFIRPIIWHKLVHTLTYAQKPYNYLWYGIETSFFIFIICIIIDILKRTTIDPIVNLGTLKLTNMFKKWSLKD